MKKILVMLLMIGSASGGYLAGSSPEAEEAFCFNNEANGVLKAVPAPMVLVTRASDGANAMFPIPLSMVKEQEAANAVACPSEEASSEE